MTADKKILKALRSTITHLENFIRAMNKKDEISMANSVWHVGAELEYALFLFSITLRDEADKSKWNLNPKLKKLEAGPTLVTAQDLLNEAEKNMTNKKSSDAYRNAYIARHYVLKVQKDFAKKKREALKKK